MRGLDKVDFAALHRKAEQEQHAARVARLSMFGLPPKFLSHDALTYAGTVLRLNPLHTLEFPYEAATNMRDFVEQCRSLGSTPFHQWALIHQMIEESSGISD